MPQDDIISLYAQRVGYTDQEAAYLAPGDPRARHLARLSQVSPLYAIQAEVTEARHCNSGYRAGDRFLLDVDGNFITKLCPKRMCVYLVSQLALPVALINERLSEGLDPNQIHCTRQIHCPDVGVECGGYGTVRLKVSVVPRAQGANPA